VTIDHNEPELLVVFQQIGKFFNVKAIITEVKTCVDWAERFEIYNHFLFLSFVVYNIA